jgi:hypothetical protein
VLHELSTTVMDLHKTLQLIAKFETMQVPIAHIVKEKLLALHIWFIYVLLKVTIIKIKNFNVIKKTKKITCSMTI